MKGARGEKRFCCLGRRSCVCTTQDLIQQKKFIYKNAYTFLCVHIKMHIFQDQSQEAFCAFMHLWLLFFVSLNLLCLMWLAHDETSCSKTYIRIKTFVRVWWKEWCMNISHVLFDDEKRLALFSCSNKISDLIEILALYFNYL